MVKVMTLLAAVIVATACGGGSGGDPESSDNLIQNAGFEDGEIGWSARIGIPTISSDQAKSGSNSLLVSMAVDEESPASGVEHAYQTVGADEVPEFLSFDYYVAEWVRGTEKQYIDVAVIVTGDGPGTPQCPGPENPPCPNIQMRYVLAGVTTEPAVVLNARWRYTGDIEPTTGEWLRFEANLRDEMTEDWSSLPSNIQSVRLQFQVRYDEKSPDELDAAAEVYWDNVYLGPR